MRSMLVMFFMSSCWMMASEYDYKTIGTLIFKEYQDVRSGKHLVVTGLNLDQALDIQTPMGILVMTHQGGLNGRRSERIVGGSSIAPHVQVWGPAIGK